MPEDDTRNESDAVPGRVQVGWRDGLVALGLVVAVPVFFSDLLSGERTLYFRDLQTFFYPMKHFLAASLRAGEIPWWNPHILGGSPFMANLESGVFYPPNLLFHSLPLPVAMNTFLILHLVLGALGAYALQRHRGAGPEASAFGALVFTFGGVTLSLVNVLNNLQGAVWAPWILLAWGAYCREGGRGRRFLVTTAVLFVVQFLAGAPVIVIITGALAALHGTVQPGARPVRTLVALAWAGLLALTMAAFQLAPTLQMIRLSTRQAIDSGTGWSLQFGTLASLLVPRAYFPNDGEGGVLLPAFEPEAPWLLSLYVGPLVLTMAALGARATRRRRETIAWGAAFVILTVLSLGANLPIVASLLEIPLFRGAFRIPEKFFWGAFLALTMLATDGFSLWRGRTVPAWMAPAVLAGVALLGLGGLSLGASMGPELSAIRNRAIGVVLLGVLLLAWPSQTPGRRTFAAIPSLLLLVLLLDLRWVNGPVNPTATGETYARPAAAGFLASTGGDRFRVQTGESILAPGRTLGVSNDASPAERRRRLRSGLAPNVGVPFGVDTFYGAEPMKSYTSAFYLNRLESIEDPERLARLRRLVNLRYVLTREPHSDPFLVDTGRTSEGWSIHEVAGALPRAYVAARLRVVPTGRFAEELFDGDFDPALEVLTPGREESVRGGVSIGTPGEARIVAYRGREVLLEADMSDAGFLVLLDAGHPGWSVSVNGRAQEILPAFGLFRAVELPAGRHRVRFVYREPRVRTGALVSLVGVLLATLTLTGIPWVRRRPGATAQAVGR